MFAEINSQLAPHWSFSCCVSNKTLQIWQNHVLIGGSTVSVQAATSSSHMPAAGLTDG